MVLDITVESISFIVVSYLLLNAMYAFRANIVWVLFFATNVWLIQKYWQTLRKSLGNRIAAIVVTAISLLILAVVFLWIGYLPIGLMPQKL
jgi:hypothetical protein